jgi:hypothetical protein
MARRLFSTIPLFALVFAVGALAAAAQTGVKGKIRTNRGDGIANAIVIARKDGKDVRSSKSDSKGNFVLDGLESGRYNIVFDANGYTSGVLYNVEVKKGVVRDLGERLMLSTDPGTQVIIRGSVFFLEGTSVTGAKIEMERVNADGSTKSLGNAVTNVSGEFTFRRPPGVDKLRITASYKGVEGSKVVDVDNPAIYRLAITLKMSRNDR